MDLQTAVRELRKATGESQQAFATNIGISIRALANYEAGQREPDIKTVAALLRVGNCADRVDLCDFLFGYIRQALGFDLMVSPETEEREPHGYLITTLNNQEEVDFAIKLFRGRRGPITDGTEEIRNQMDALMSGRRGIQRKK